MHTVYSRMLHSFVLPSNHLVVPLQRQVEGAMDHLPPPPPLILNGQPPVMKSGPLKL